MPTISTATFKRMLHHWRPTDDSPAAFYRHRRDRLPRCRPSRRACAFTLIELLTVIAILGILSAILLPTLSGARVAANKAKTRAQFAQWSAAFEAFRQEYGAYPQLFTASAQKLVNQGANTTATAEHLFHDTLAGQRRDPSATNWQSNRPGRTPPFPETQNSRRVRFVSFSESDFVTPADVSAGRNTAAQLNLLRDAFYNTSLAVVTDANLDGVINGRDSSGGFPAVLVPGGATTIRPTTVLTSGTTGGTRAGVLFYSAPSGATSENDLVMSWR
jgi:prepilin-type N-terminal cleavage/methylation domain-containing protein